MRKYEDSRSGSVTEGILLTAIYYEIISQGLMTKVDKKLLRRKNFFVKITFSKYEHETLIKKEHNFHLSN